MAVVGTFNQTNKLADGYQVEVDVQLMRATEDGGRQAAKGKIKDKRKAKAKRAEKAARA
jgi:hypothetical protein